MKLKTEQLVTALLEQKPELRSSDKKLLLAFWHYQGLHLTEEQREIFMNCTSAETIRRNRQKIQERGLYPPTEAVREARYEHFKEHLEEFATPRAVHVSFRDDE